MCLGQMVQLSLASGEGRIRHCDTTARRPVTELALRRTRRLQVQTPGRPEHRLPGGTPCEVIMAIRTLLWRGLDAPRMELVRVESLDRARGTQIGIA